MKGGPQDLGFDESVMTVGGIQSPPYAWMTDGKFPNNYPGGLVYYESGNYRRPSGTSIISPRKSGEGEGDWDSSSYNQRLVTETENFLDGHLSNPSTRNKPFFSYVALGGVHIPHSPPKFWRDGVTPIKGQFPTPHMDLLYEMDLVVGSLVQGLTDRGLLEDTIVIFTTDNGGLGGKYGSRKAEHFGSGDLRDSKGSIYEGGHRVPFIMRWDNGDIPANERRTKPLSHSDVYRTLAEFASVFVGPEQALDSVSFAQYAVNGQLTDTVRRSLGTWRVKNNVLVSESIRVKNMKVVRYPQENRAELYDLKRDIGERSDISGSNPLEVRDMLRQLDDFGMCRDSRKQFDVSGTSQNCKYFREDTLARCRDSFEGQVNCRLTCAVVNNQEDVCKYFDSGSRRFGRN